MARFQDKVVIVTGGARGIGEAACISFAKEGAKVAVADILDQGKEVADQLNAQGYDAIFVKTDVAKEEDVINLVNKTVEKYGKLDVMCANAGVSPYKPAVEHTKEDMDYAYGINLYGAFYCDKYAVIQMLKQGTKGAIVNTASVFSHVGRANSAAYASSKGGVKVLTQSFALAHSAQGIRCNAVCPGVIMTPMMEGILQNEEHYNIMVSMHPIGRLGKPQDIANAILFLASEEADFITGAYLCVDGGYTAQ